MRRLLRWATLHSMGALGALVSNRTEDGCEMALRSVRERVIQTFAYELIGLLVIAPVVARFHGMDTFESATLLISVSVTCLAWAPIHNTLFDLADWRCSGRVASDRPQCWRIVHAVSLEVSSTLITVPVIMLLADYSFLQALFLDVTLTITYSAYAYLFHMTYDWLRPVLKDEVKMARPYP